VSGGEPPHSLRSGESLATVRVAVDLPGAQGERLYDYLPPERGSIAVGEAVVVPFGGRRAVGIVTSEVGLFPPPPAVVLKRIEARLGDGALIGPLGMRLAERIAEHWLAPLALTVRALLPPGLLDKVEVAVRANALPSEAERRVGISESWRAVDRLIGARGAGRTALLALIRTGEREGRLERSWHLGAVAGRVIEEPYATLSNAGVLQGQQTRIGLRQRELLAQLERAAEGEEPFVRVAELPGGLPAARRLEQLGMLQLSSRRKQRRHADRRDVIAVDTSVIHWSTTQVALLEAPLTSGVTLLDGPPGSGKSRVAAELAARTLAAGHSVLWLVPEATQVAVAADALRAITGVEAELVHAVASQGERLDAHARLAVAGPHLVVGTRVALGALSREVGLVVVDEEHESGYKSERSPRLHARDAALMLAKEASAPAILISATPAIETLARAERSGWRHLTLQRRSTPIRVEVVDMRRELEEGWKSMISRPLLAALEELNWEEGDQALLIMNRRGLASALLCRDCGAGLEVEVKRLLPTIGVARLDADTATAIGAGDRILDAFREGRTQILVGTALAAKALDLPRLALVGIVSADAGLLLPDERAAERVVSLIVQASGRLGRGGREGAAWVQSYRPEDPAILAAVEVARGGDVSAWRRREIALRESAGGAPFLRTAKLTISGVTAKGTHARATLVGEQLRARLADQPGARLLGPIPAWVPKRAGRWRENLILRSPDPLPLVRGLAGRDVSVDLDPETLL